MPLHIDLHHEIAQQEQARRRDPLRVGMIALLVIAVGFVGYYFWAMERSFGVNTRYASLAADWSRMEPKAKAAKAREEELQKQIAATDALTKTIEGRFYWAPVLEQVAKTIPREVQLVRLNAETPSNGPSNLVTIGGVSSGVEPRKEAEAVRTALETRLKSLCHHVVSSFRSLEDSDQSVMLEGQRLPTVSFSMEFQMRLRDAPAATPEAAAAPARRPRETNPAE